MTRRLILEEWGGVEVLRWVRVERCSRGRNGLIEVRWGQSGHWREKAGEQAGLEHAVGGAASWSGPERDSLKTRPGKGPFHICEN